MQRWASRTIVAMYPKLACCFGKQNHKYVTFSATGAGYWPRFSRSRTSFLHGCLIHSLVQVAVKIVNKRKAPKDYLKKFLPREIEVLQRLDHPHCVSLFGARTLTAVIFFFIFLNIPLLLAAVCDCVC